MHRWIEMVSSGSASGWGRPSAKSVLRGHACALASLREILHNRPMRRVRPVTAILFVLAIGAALWFTDQLVQGGFSQANFERVAPGRDGTVRVSLAGLGPSQVRFYRFLNAGNQEVRFFVGKDPQGALAVAFDANEICAKAKRGYRHEGDWVVCNKCDKAFRLAEVNAGGGGCKPIPLAYRVEGDELQLSESDVLKGWRYFN